MKMKIAVLFICGLFALGLAVGEESLTTTVRAVPSLSVGVNIDVNAIATSITENIRKASNREAFVKSTLATAFYGANSMYNVVVFNQAQAKEERLSPDAQYMQFNYNGLYYGVWIFSYGTFHNRGDGGYKNWAYRGCVQRDGGYLSFRRYLSATKCPAPKQSTFKAPCTLGRGKKCSSSSQCCGGLTCRGGGGRRRGGRGGGRKTCK